MPRSHTVVSFALLFCLATGPAAGGDVERLHVVDFEGFTEMTPIRDQYAALGVYFSILGHPTEAPIIAVEGLPAVAFGAAGADEPMTSGQAGLTDPLVGGSVTVGRGIVVSFDPPVTSVGVFLIDLDEGEPFSVRAQDDGVDVASMTKSLSDADAGDGLSTPFVLTADRITTVVIEPPDFVGFAVDFLTFTRPQTPVFCASRLEISQETLPGADDFDNNILGEILPYPVSGTIGEFYAYDVPQGTGFGGRSITPVADRSHLLIVDTFDGRSLVVVHDDEVGDADGGRAEMVLEFEEACSATRSIEDDPLDMEGGYLGDAGSSIFTASNVWSATGADGFAISGLDDDESTVILQFTEVDGGAGTPPLVGLTEWMAYSADGTLVPLALQVGRRVRIRTLPGEACRQDINCDGKVDFNDLLEVLSMFGHCQ